MASTISEFVASAMKSDKLLPLEDLDHERVWDFQAPTLVMKGRIREGYKIKTTEEFTQKFFEDHPILRGIDLSHLCFGGGCVLNPLTGLKTRDVDTFVVTGQKMERKEGFEFAHKRSSKFLGDLYHAMEKKNQALREEEAARRLAEPDFRVDPKEFYDLEQFKVYRFLNLDTALLPNMSSHVEVLNTPFESVQRAFDSFDLPCCELAFYQGKVLMSELAKFCLENRSLVIDKHYIDHIHMARVKKYFHKGFDLILWGLDLANDLVADPNDGGRLWVELPYLRARVVSMSGNRIEIEDLEMGKKVDDSREEKGLRDALTAIHMRDSDKLHSYVNVYNLVNNHWSDFIFHGKGKLYTNAFLDRPIITKGMIRQCYKEVGSSIWGVDESKADSLFAWMVAHGDKPSGESFPEPHDDCNQELPDEIKTAYKKLTELQCRLSELPKRLVEGWHPPGSPEDWYGHSLPASQ